MPPKKRKERPSEDVHTHTHTFSIAHITGQPVNVNDPITTYVDRSSLDNRRRYEAEIAFEPPSPIKRFRQGQVQLAPPPQIPAGSGHAFNLDLDFDSGRYEMGLDGNDADDEDEGARRRERATRAPKIVKPSDPALHRFRGLRDNHLSCLLRRDGCMRGNPEICRDCKNRMDPEESPSFRCEDCFGDEMVCGDCIVARHRENPLHRIERWNGFFFTRTSLRKCGLRVQLGHAQHERCPEATPLHRDFVVLHTNGIHKVAVDICDCEHKNSAGSAEDQMLRAGWFPATDMRARTCATFACLDLFILSMHQAKTTMYDFYAMLEKLTDNTGVKPPNRYAAFIRMSREYRHLLMLKRAGRAHEPTGVAGTQPGELAVLCPCCPDPAVNLPEGWNDVCAEDRFLYILYLALDACFRLKRRLVSSERKDPPLGAGWAYMVDTVPYRQYLLSVTDQKEMSTCSGLAALDYANTKFARGYSATGVGMGVCARHEFVQPNSVGDLQRGERYANMDYIFACILRLKDHRLLKLISYDIVCQWWKNLKERLKKLPGIARLVVAMNLMRFVIPKMHIHSHTQACQLLFSLNLIPGSAQTDGEGIERPWAHIGGVASSTREMGPGSREDVLNCHWGFWNWQKLVGLAERLRTRSDRANEEYATQLEAFTQFSVQQADRVPEWRGMVEVFEKDEKQKNPYQMTTRAITEADVLLKLEEEEAERVNAGMPGIHSVSPSSFVAAGLEVEDQQWRVRVQIELKKAQTTAQKIDVIALRRKLNQSLRRFRTLQATYTPTAIVALGRRTDVPENEQPENVPLFLPSGLTEEDRAVEPVAGLAVIEESLRDAQCSTSLVRLRNQLHMKSRLLTYKAIQARHQGPNTRSRTIVARNESKIRLHSEKYQMAWEVMRRLAGGDASKVGWRVLRVEDIRCMEDAEERARGAEKRKAQEERRRRREDQLREEGELPPLTDAERQERVVRGGENMREISWIWAAAGTAGSDAELEDALRIEWSKAWARTRRWHEETRMVMEEARRLPVSLEHRAKEWERRVQQVPLGTIAFEEAQGAITYGLKQAALYRDIAERAGVTMTEERRGKGRPRRRIVEDEDVFMDGGGVGGNGAVGEDSEDDEDEIGLDDDEDELEQWAGDVSDEEHLLGGGEDDD